MKKTLLAAALVAGFTGVAQAETSVTLYGVIDTGLGFTTTKVDRNATSQSRFGMITGQQSGSRWGLKGTEDLGDGLRAVFVLESGFDSRDGNSKQGGRLFGRQATVGLEGDSWGSLNFGRQTNIASQYFASIDPFGAGFGSANIGVSMGSVNTVRYDNMVAYQTPSLSGFKLGVGYSFNTDDNSYGSFRTADNLRAVTAGIRYDNGPLAVAFGYDQQSYASNASGAVDGAKPRTYVFGLSYDFEVVKVSAAYANTRNGWIGGQSFGSSYGGVQGFDAAGVMNDPTATGRSATGFADGFKANSFMLGVSAPVGPQAKVLASWQHVRPSNGRLTGSWTEAMNSDGTPVVDAAGNQLYTIDGGRSKMNVYSLGYTYDLSKRTNVYSYAAYARNVAFIDGARSTEVGVGVRHRF